MQYAPTMRRDELIAHDCALEGNPSHSGIDDLEREGERLVRVRDGKGSWAD